MLKEIEYEYVNVLGIKFKFYKPVIEDLIGRRFTYINVQDNGNDVRLGNDKEEFSFYDYKYTESLFLRTESITEPIGKAVVRNSSDLDLKYSSFTDVSLFSDGSECMSLSWTSDNVKLTYVSKENKQ